MTNTTNTVLSAEVKNILDTYEKRFFQSGLIRDCWEMLMSALFVEMVDDVFWNNLISVLSTFDNESELYGTIKRNVDAIKRHNLLLDEELTLLVNNYREVIEYCCDLFSKEHIPHFASEKTQPCELSKLCCELLNIEEGSSVYLPFSGVASSLSMLPNCTVDIEEINPETAAQAYIHSTAYPNIHHNVKNTDSFIELISCSKLYDYVLFSPPFSVGRQDRLKETDAVRMAIENKLKHGGKLCCVLPLSLFYSVTELEFRQFLVDTGYLRAIISLPRIYKPSSSVQMVVLLLEKSPLDSFIVIDGSQYFVTNQNNRRREILNINSLLIEYEQCKKENRGVFTKADLNEDYNLNPSRLLFQMPGIKADEKLYKIGDLVSFVGKSLSRRDTSVSEDFLIERLSDDYMSCEVDRSSEDNHDSRYRYCIPTPALVAQIIYDKMKIGKISGELGTCVVGTLTASYFMQANHKLILDDYLLKMLKSEFVASQIKAMSVGASFPHLAKKDFYEIQIPVPSLEKQKELMIDDLYEGIDERDEQIQADLEEYKKDVRIKKHAVGQLLFGLNSNWLLLNIVRKMSAGCLKEDMIIDEEDHVTLKDVLDNIEHQIQAVSNAVENFTAGEEIYEVKEFALVPFFEDYISKHKNVNYSLFLETSDEEYTTDGVSAATTKYVKFPPEALNRILLDILTNAMEYGFKDCKSTNNKVRIQIYQDNINYIVEVSNNGNPVNPNLDPKDVFKYGVTTSGHRNKHSGIGGYETKKLMERYNGSVEFISTPNEDYTVTYKLTFRDNNIIRDINSEDIE